MRENILIVEDDDPVRCIAARILRRRGYTVLEARGADEARSICAESGPTIDLLLIDVVMPETTGPKLAAELSEAMPRVRILYMSGHSGSALAGGDGFVAKPFTPASLVDEVQHVLDACA